MEKPNYQYRTNFFWVSEKLFPHWPYADKRAIITRLDNAWFKDKGTYRFVVKGAGMYEIAATKANYLGAKYPIPSDKKGKQWCLIPVQEFDLLSPSIEMPFKNKPEPSRLL